MLRNLNKTKQPFRDTIKFRLTLHTINEKNYYLCPVNVIRQLFRQ